MLVDKLNSNFIVSTTNINTNVNTERFSKSMWLEESQRAGKWERSLDNNERKQDLKKKAEVWNMRVREIVIGN